MQCQVCQQKEATIHLTEITDGVRNEIHLCEQCAMEEGIAVKSKLSINELLSGLLSTQPSDDDLFGDTEQDISCPHCGFTLSQFSEKAVLGCPYDYEIFEKSLNPIIKKAHGGKTTHQGKVPSKTPKNTKKQMKLLALRQQLEAAVQSEDYELAAKLRDEISQLE